MIYLVAFQEQGAESTISVDRFSGPLAVVNFTARQCTVEAESEDEAREQVEQFNQWRTPCDIYNKEHVPRDFIQILKVEQI